MVVEEEVAMEEEWVVEEEVSMEEEWVVEEAEAGAFAEWECLYLFVCY